MGRASRRQIGALGLPAVHDVVGLERPAHLRDGLLLVPGLDDHSVMPRRRLRDVVGVDAADARAGAAACEPRHVGRLAERLPSSVG